MAVEADRDIVHPTTRAEWREWLESHHTRGAGVWVASYKAATGKPRVPYAELVEEALCFGWIDSKPNPLDDERSIQWFSPRKPKSPWSKLNKQRIERLERDGLMTAAGRAVVERSKVDGSWNAYDAVEALAVPDDLAAALDGNPVAKGYFEAFPPSSKKIILWWIESAKRPETRARRVEETVRLAAENIRANHYRQP